VEGVFQQVVAGAEGAFVGSCPASLPDPVNEDVARRSMMLGLLFQHLGYVGRCSFDLLLVGPDFDHSRLEFVECNGRWGGTSVPMMLMNRLFGDWTRQPFATRVCEVRGLETFTFLELLRQFQDDLFDIRTETGWLLFFTPGRMQAQSGIGVVALAPTWAQATERLEVELPELLANYVSRRVCA